MKVVFTIGMIISQKASETLRLLAQNLPFLGRVSNLTHVDYAPKRRPSRCIIKSRDAHKSKRSQKMTSKSESCLPRERELYQNRQVKKLAAT